jgi:alpha-mannosidase
MSSSGAAEVDSQVASLENKSLFFLDTANVVLETAKKAEMDDAIVLRFYESFGRRGQVNLYTPFAVRQAREADLLESDLFDLPVNRDSQGSIVAFSIKPYEIKTVKLWIEAGKQAIAVS